MRKLFDGHFLGVGQHGTALEQQLLFICIDGPINSVFATCQQQSLFSILTLFDYFEHFSL